jgi:hypothetical protein
LSGAKSDVKVEGVIPHLVDGGLSILQYADDIYDSIYGTRHRKSEKSESSPFGF